MARKLRALVRRLLIKRLPRGNDLFVDLRRDLPNLEVRMVFDVGANVGQSATAYLKEFRNAEIHSFEPVAATYEQLRRRFADEARFHAHHTAFGAEAGSATMSTEGSTDVFFVIPNGEAAEGATETVPLDTLDTFCARVGIEHISLLKIDTEGFDLEVLKGAHRMLSEGQIDLVQVEAGMNPENERHVRFERLKAHLEATGYRLFAFYEQRQERQENKPQLRRTNPVFLSPSIIRAHSA